MVGRATFVMATSSTTIRYAMPSTASAFHRLGSAPRAMPDPDWGLDSSILATCLRVSSIAMGFSSIGYRVGPPPELDGTARDDDDFAIRSTGAAGARLMDWSVLRGGGGSHPPVHSWFG